MRIYLAIVSLIFWVWLFATSILATTTIFIGYIPMRLLDPKRRFAHFIACLWGAGSFLPARLLGVCRIRVEGKEKIPTDTPCVIVANHQSQLDILCTFCTFVPFLWVSKASMFKVPFVGWGMALTGYIGLKRDDSASIKEMLRDCRSAIEQGHSVLIFPEGTRSKDGHVQRFKTGAFMIATRSKAPVVPLFIDGTFDALRPKAWAFHQPLRISIRFGDPISADAIKAKELTQTCEDLFRNELG